MVDSDTINKSTILRDIGRVHFHILKKYSEIPNSLSTTCDFTVISQYFFKNMEILQVEYSLKLLIVPLSKDSKHKMNLQIVVH